MAMISDKTVCMRARQGETGEYRHYDVHSLYGWSQTESTLQWVQTLQCSQGSYMDMFVCRLFMHKYPWMIATPIRNHRVRYFLTFSRTLLRTSLTILVMHFPGQHFYWYMCTCERRAGTKFTRIAAGDSSTSTCWFNWIISIHVDLVCIVFSGSRKMIRMFFIWHA